MTQTAKDFRKGRLALLGVFAVTLATPSLAQVTVDRVKQRGQVTIGYRDDASPFSFKASTGTPTGYAVDLCLPIASRLAQQAGLAPNAIRYLAVPVDQMERYMKGGNLDLMCSATSDTAERRRTMDFSAPIFVASVKMLVLKQDNLQSVAQLGGKPVGVIDKTTAAQAVADYAQQKSVAFSISKLVGPDAALGQLKLGWIKGYARDDVLLAMQLASASDAKDYGLLPEAMSSENIAIAFSAGDAAMQKLVGQVLAESRSNGAWAAAYDRWFMKPIPPANKSLNIAMPDALKASIDKVK